MTQTRKNALLALLLIGLIGAWAAIAGCSVNSADSRGAESSNSSQGTKTESKELKKVRVQLGWFPEPEYGGEYAALAKGFFQEEGLDVELLPGAPTVNGIQLVATGKADLGLTKADKLLASRADGIPIKAIAGVFQKSPQALIYHEGANINSFEDLKGRTIFFVPGVFGYEYVRHKYKLNDLNEQVHDGSFVRFLNDKESVVHGFATSETATFKAQNIPTKYLLIADSGYNPYEAVVFATEQYLQDNPDIVRAYLRALKKGWEYYRGHAEEINVTIHELNKEVPLEAMKEQAALGEQFIFGGDAEKEGWGVMKVERWEENKQQLLEIGALKKDLDVKEAFTTEFLP